MFRGGEPGGWVKRTRRVRKSEASGEDRRKLKLDGWLANSRAELTGGTLAYPRSFEESLTAASRAVSPPRGRDYIVFLMSDETLASKSSNLSGGSLSSRTTGTFRSAIARDAIILYGADNDSEVLRSRSSRIGRRDLRSSEKYFAS